jgi:hypothetical protein
MLYQQDDCQSFFAVPFYLVMMTVMEELRVLVRGVQQVGELYLFIIPRGKHEPLFCCAHFGGSLKEKCAI